MPACFLRDLQVGGDHYLSDQDAHVVEPFWFLYPMTLHP